MGNERLGGYSTILKRNYGCAFNFAVFRVYRRGIYPNTLKLVKLEI